MDYYAYGGVCLARPQNEPLPPGALRVSEPFDPTVFLFYDLSPQAAGLIHTNGKTLLNTAYANAYRVLDRMLAPPPRFRLNLVGLGDVGGALLTGLKLLGHDVEQIGIFDPDEARMARYEMELNQVLPIDGRPLPKITCIGQDQLFACDALLFTASKGVPPLGQGGGCAHGPIRRQRRPVGRLCPAGQGPGVYRPVLPDLGPGGPFGPEPVSCQQPAGGRPL